jgi:hypothetical protein
MSDTRLGKLAPSLNARLHEFAASLGVTWDEVILAVSQHTLHLTPGKVTKDDPEPLPIGTVINLRRGFPGSKEAEDDKGWVVAGYLRRTDGRWKGYDLRRGPWQIQTGTVSNAEAFDVVGSYEVGT